MTSGTVDSCGIETLRNMFIWWWDNWNVWGENKDRKQSGISSAEDLQTSTVLVTQASGRKGPCFVADNANVK
jgi:hypothetical protein